MKKILYLLPFILYTIFYLFIIIAEGGTGNLAVPDVLLLLALLLLCGLGALSKKKTFNLIGIISLFILSFALIKMGIENDYFALAETKIAVAILVYYLIAFIISNDKRLIIMNGIVIGILLILFVPIKIQYRDGGTVEYRAVAYKFIKWNTIRDDDSFYKDDTLCWFPNNFHSLEYHKPVEIPMVNVSVNNQQISCNGGSYHWSKTVDGQNIMSIGCGISPINMTYKENLIITNDNIISIDTSYNISDVEYTEYEEEYANSELDVVIPVFNKLDFNSEDKSIDLKNLENGIYIISFTINNNEDYADYSFKVEVKK